MRQTERERNALVPQSLERELGTGAFHSRPIMDPLRLRPNQGDRGKPQHPGAFDPLLLHRVVA